MRDLATTEHHGHLDLVLLFQEPPGVARLGLEIVIVDARTELHFLELDHVLLLLRDACLLGHLELVLAVVHDADDGRPRGRGDFDKIEPCFFGHSHRDIDFEDAELRSVRADDANWADANLPIDPHPLGGVLNRRYLLKVKNETRPLSERESRATGLAQARAPSND